MARLRQLVTVYKVRVQGCLRREQVMSMHICKMFVGHYIKFTLAFQLWPIQQTTWLHNLGIKIMPRCEHSGIFDLCYSK